MKTAIYATIVLCPIVLGMALSTVAPQFGPTAYYPISPTHFRTGTFIHVADVNHDGFADVIVVAADTTAITVWLGDGSGKLKTRIDSDIVERVYAAGNVAVG